MPINAPDTTKDVPVITVRTLIWLHAGLILFIALVRWRLVTLPGN